VFGTRIVATSAVGWSWLSSVLYWTCHALASIGML
jgi:hypothetical protein